MRHLRTKYIYLSAGLLAVLLATLFLVHDKYRNLRQFSQNTIQANTIISKYNDFSKDFQIAMMAKPEVAERLSDDIRQLRYLSSDTEYQKRLDTLNGLISSSKNKIIGFSVVDTPLSVMLNKDYEIIGQISDVINRGELHVIDLSMQKLKSTDESLLSMYFGLVFWTVTIAGTVILGLLFILAQIRMREAQLKQNALQRQRLDEIAWIQSHKVRAQVATILGLVQLYNEEHPSDTINVEVLQGMREAAEQLDQVIREIDNKTRVHN